MDIGDGTGQLMQAHPTYSGTVSTLGTPVRRVIHEAVRGRVGGPERAAFERVVFQGAGERWFHPGDPIWTVHSDPSMFVGGLRALLVQALHPLAMAGVGSHSDFRDDPWGRLQRTSQYIAMTTFGPVREAERLLARIRGVHRRVNGIDAAGRAFAARDPHLLAWVHCAEAESFLTTYQIFGERPLSPAEADQYVAQIGSVNERLGAPGLPTTVAGLHARLLGYLPELEAGALSRETIAYLLDHPPLHGPGRAVYEVLAGGAVSSVPGWARPLVLDGRGSSARRDQWRSSVAARRSAQALTGAFRWAIEHPARVLPALDKTGAPTNLRAMPTLS